MIFYLYDGSFEGLLTAIYEAFYAEEKPTKIVMKTTFQENLFARKVDIITSEEKADKVYQAIKDKISSKTLKKVYYAYLSESEDVETLIYQYLIFGFKTGKEINRHLTEDKVLKLNQISHKVSWERHRLLGLIRFRKLANDIYYAPIEPDHNVVTLLAPHFSSRMADQNWIIHDLKREIAVLYNQEEWVLTELVGKPENFAEDEEFYQSLWRDFFDSIAIKNRKNPRLQKQYMPVRYWKHLIEK